MKEFCQKRKMCFSVVFYTDPPIPFEKVVVSKSGCFIRKYTLRKLFNNSLIRFCSEILMDQGVRFFLPLWQSSAVLQD